MHVAFGRLLRSASNCGSPPPPQCIHFAYQNLIDAHQLCVRAGIAGRQQLTRRCRSYAAAPSASCLATFTPQRKAFSVSSNASPRWFRRRAALSHIAAHSTLRFHARPDVSWPVIGKARHRLSGSWLLCRDGLMSDRGVTSVCRHCDPLTPAGWDCIATCSAS